MTYTSILQISDRLFQCPRRAIIGDDSGGILGMKFMSDRPQNCPPSKVQ